MPGGRRIPDRAAMSLLFLLLSVSPFLSFLLSSSRDNDSMELISRVRVPLTLPFSSSSFSSFFCLLFFFFFLVFLLLSCATVDPLRVATVTATGTRLTACARYGKKAGQGSERNVAAYMYTLFIIRFVIHNAPLVALLWYLLAAQ